MTWRQILEKPREKIVFLGFEHFAIGGGAGVMTRTTFAADEFFPGPGCHLIADGDL